MPYQSDGHSGTGPEGAQWALGGGAWKLGHPCARCDMEVKPEGCFGREPEKGIPYRPSSRVSGVG
eukprot:6284680-Alexandrium_andersonii.AAC.1